ncbi:unnamed protein product [Agarophyton chilense]
MSGAASKNDKADGKPSASKPKRRAQPGDFEKQVDRIQHDIDKIRANLAAAEKALQICTTAESPLAHPEGQLDKQSDHDDAADQQP